MFRKSPSQSQSISGTQITGSQVQQAQAGQTLNQSQAGNLATSQQGLSGAEVLKLLEELEAIVKTTDLPDSTKSKSLNCLQVAKDEVEEEKANKDLIASNLKRVSETLDTVNKTTDAGKSLWQKGQEVFKAIAPWLGSAAKLLEF